MENSQAAMGSLREKIRELFRISGELELAFPGRKFTLDGHLVGSIGEVIAAFHYGLQLLPSSYEKHDAKDAGGRLVQIKATQGNRWVCLRSVPDYLIVLFLNSRTGEAREIYNGPGAPVWEACGKLTSVGVRPIALSRLKALAEGIPADKRIKQVMPLA